MFPITHIWFSNTVLGYTNNLTVLGAIYSDAFISKHLTYDNTHKCDWAFFDYIMKKNHEFSDFAKAIATHTVYPKGLDYYGDKQYLGSDGYCFQKAPLIVNDVIDACNLPIELGLWKAHNFIEMAVEIEVISANEKISQVFKEALLDNGIMNNLELLIEQYFNLIPGSLKNSFKKFEPFAEISDTNSYKMALLYSSNMKRRHGISINVEKSSKIIDISREIINKDFKEFINNVENRVKNMIADRIDLYDKKE